MNAAPRKRVLHRLRPLAETSQAFPGRGLGRARLDINPAVNPDIVASMADMAAAGTASFDALYSSHNLEHLTLHETPLALREFYRVLKSEGFALVTLPDLQQVAECIARGEAEHPVRMTDKGPIMPLDMLYWFKPFLAANPFMAHRFGFTAETLRTAFVLAGFARASVERDGEFSLWAVAPPTALA